MSMPRPDTKRLWIRLKALEYIKERKSTREALQAAIRDWEDTYRGTFILDEYDTPMPTDTTIQPRI